MGICAVSKPSSSAYFLAPAPTSMTCCVRSMTARATLIGWAIPSKNATEPHLESPDIIQASSVTCPSRSGLPPTPTLRFVKSASVTITPFSTASSTDPPSDKTFQAPSLAARPCSQVESTIGPFAFPEKEYESV